MIEIEELDDPMANFRDALKSESAKRQYPVRLKYFFDSLYTKENEPFKPLPHISINQQIQEFMSYKDNKQKIEQCFRKMLRIQSKRVESGEIEEGTIYNYYKAAKVFCDQNDITATWKKITKIIPSGRRDADDRVPTDEEIQRLIGYPDKRLKPIIFTMISSGIRIESWNYLRWKHITPIYEHENRSGKLLGAKIIVYAGEKDQYYSFLTPEAFTFLKSYMDFRASHGEEINGNSWIMRDLFESTIKNGVNLGKAKTPKQLTPAGIKSLLERAATSEGLFKPLDLKNGEKRREWKVAHGLRKLFKTRCETAGMRSLHIEMLLGHNTGVTKSYYRPLESEILADYQKAIPLLTIEAANKQVDKITADITRKVTAGLNEQIRELTNKYALTNFKREIDNIVVNSKSIANELMRKEGSGELEKVEWSKEEQLSYFMSQMKKIGEEVTEDQINYIKEYLERSWRVELYKVGFTETEKEREKLIEQDKHRFEEKYKQMSPEQQEKLQEKFPKLKGKSDEEIAKELRRLGELYSKDVNEIEKWLLVKFVEDDLEKDNKRKEKK